MFRDTAIGTPAERRIAIVNHGGVGRVSIGIPRRGRGHEWLAIAENLDRDDMMILAGVIREVAETLPWEPQC